MKCWSLPWRLLERIHHAYGLERDVGHKNAASVMYLDEKDIGDADQSWEAVLFLRDLAVSHGLEFAVVNGEVGAEVAAIWEGGDERSQGSHGC